MSTIVAQQPPVLRDRIPGRRSKHSPRVDARVLALGRRTVGMASWPLGIQSHWPSVVRRPLGATRRALALDARGLALAHRWWAFGVRAQTYGTDTPGGRDG